MTSVFLVCQSDWESSSVVSIHTTREKAQEVVAYIEQGRNMEFKPFIVERALDDFRMQLLPKGKTDYRVDLHRDKDMDEWTVYVEEGDCEEDRTDATTERSDAWYYRDRYFRFVTHVWAVDRSEAVRIAYEQADKAEWEIVD